MERKIGRRSWKKPVVTGLVVGALAGAALSALFAPKSGREIRQQLGGALHKVRERVSSHR